MSAAHRNYQGADAWRNNLICSDKGIPKPLLANAITALRDCLSWQGVLAFNEFALETILTDAPPWFGGLEFVPRAWEPQDDLYVTDWLQHNGIAVSSREAAKAVETVARDRSFHPVQDYLASLKHDGTARLQTWLRDYLGAEDSEYTATVGRCMMVAAVARIFNPGCKVDTVPILEGVQGARKSTAIKTLFDPWFSDELADLGSKDARMQTRGIWGIEISELDSMNRSETSRIKAFISRTTDRFRPPFGHRVIESPRSCVFWGTTNTDNYLRDETGGRRFWPIQIGKIDIDGLAEARAQLWAEAVVLYDANVPWWITKDNVHAAADAEQRKRYAGDPWDEVVAVCVDGKNEVSLNHVLQAAAGADHARWGQAEQNRVSRILQSMGFQRSQRRTGDKRIWIYRRVVPVVTGDNAGSNVTTFRVVTPDQVVTPEKPAGQGPAPLSPLSPLDL